MSEPKSRRLIRREDLLTLKFVGDPQMSPDGRTVLCTVKRIDAEKNRYFSHLWLVDTEGDGAREFTFGEVSDANPRWSPDGSRIAFLRTVEKQAQVWTIAADGGEARPLTSLPEGAIGALTWSPDGGKLAFTFRPTGAEWTREARKAREESGRSNPPRVITRLHYRMDGFGFLDERQHIWICDAETGEARQLTDGDFDDLSPAWSPDGARIAFVSNRSADPEETPHLVDLWWVPLEGGEPRKIETPPGYKGGLSWSPDGKLLAYVGRESEEDPWVPRHDRLWVVPLGDGEARSLTDPLDRPVGNYALSDAREAPAGPQPPLWSPDGAALYALVSDRGSCHLYRVPVDGGGPEVLTEGPFEVSALSADARCGRFALQISQPTRPAELFLGRPTGGDRGFAVEPLTDFNGPWLAEVRLSEPEELWIERPDGTRVQGWLLHPPDFSPDAKYPLLLYIHGGPHAQYGHTFFHEFQWHAARGYCVLYTNPRGSSGYSEGFLTAIRGNWGELDYDDLMAFVDHVVAERPYVDGERLGVAGGSYGGYMTNWILGHSPRFRCAVTDRSVVNLMSMFGTCDFVFSPDGYWEGNPWSRPEALLRGSPLRHLEGAGTPTLIVHSEGDLRCPIEQAEQLFTALRRLQVEVVFVRYPAETSHGLSRGGPPDLRLDRLARIGEWLDRHLRGSGDGSI